MEGYLKHLAYNFSHLSKMGFQMNGDFDKTYSAQIKIESNFKRICFAYLMGLSSKRLLLYS